VLRAGIRICLTPVSPATQRQIFAVDDSPEIEQTGYQGESRSLNFSLGLKQTQKLLCIFTADASLTYPVA